MKNFKNILVYAGNEQPEFAVASAAQLALENEASLTLMDVIKPVPKALGMVTDISTPEELEKLVADDRRRRLMELAGDLSDTGLDLDVVVAIGDPATEITRRVIDHGYDLVVKTADGFSGPGRLFGSIAKSLLRLCPCPVWLIKPQIHGKFDRVLAAIDVESDDKQHVDLNQTILELAYSIALREEAQLHVVSAWQLWMEDSMRRHAGDAVVDELRQNQQTKVQLALDELLQAPLSQTREIKIHLRYGSPAVMIRSVAHEIEADLLVMGTVCRTGVSGFLIGNTAESVVADVTCSLLALKPHGFTSPVEMTRTILTDEEVTLTRL